MLPKYGRKRDARRTVGWGEERTKRDGVCNPRAYVLCSPQRQNQGTKRYGRDCKSRPALRSAAGFVTPLLTFCAASEDRSLRFVQSMKPEARHKTLRTGLQIPSGTGRQPKRDGVCNPRAYVLCSPQSQKQGTKRYGRDYKSRPARTNPNIPWALRGLQAKSQVGHAEPDIP